MNNFEWALSICVVIWILMTSGEVSNLIGWVAIAIVMTIYYLVDNGYFGGKR